MQCGSNTHQISKARYEKSCVKCLVNGIFNIDYVLKCYFGWSSINYTIKIHLACFFLLSFNVTTRKSEMTCGLGPFSAGQHCPRLAPRSLGAPQPRLPRPSMPLRNAGCWVVIVIVVAEAQRGEHLSCRRAAGQGESQPLRGGGLGSPPPHAHVQASWREEGGREGLAGGPFELLRSKLLTQWKY